MACILVVHGPNLNLLRRREQQIYGQTSLQEINAMLCQGAKREGHEIDIVQSNHDPIDLEEAAMTDGANRFQAVLYVVMPLALPGIIATSIFTFIVAWNDYLFARILMGQEELKTLPVGVQDFFNMAVIDWGLIMAAGMMITIPALIFFVSSQKYLIEGWGGGAIKG